MRLNAETYKMRAPELAPYLLGKLLCVKRDGKTVRARICETECYFGESDTACHAHRGRTERTKTLYMEGGAAYVYLCYGIHYLLNVVSGEKDFPEAVLIRGVEEARGPGRATKYLGVDKRYNGISLIDSDEIWIEDDGVSVRYRLDKRVGIDYASEEDRDRLWRFIAER